MPAVLQPTVTLTLKIVELKFHYVYFFRLLDFFRNLLTTDKTTKMTLFGQEVVEDLQAAAQVFGKAKTIEGDYFHGIVKTSEKSMDIKVGRDIDACAGRYNFSTGERGLAKWKPALHAMHLTEHLAAYANPGHPLASLRAPRHEFAMVKNIAKSAEALRGMSRGQAGETGVAGIEEFIDEVVCASEHVLQFLNWSMNAQNKLADLFAHSHELAKQLDVSYGCAMPSAHEHIRGQLSAVNRLLPLSCVSIEISKPCARCDEIGDAPLEMVQILSEKEEGGNACGHIFHFRCASTILLEAYRDGDTQAKCPKCETSFNQRNMQLFVADRVAPQGRSEDSNVAAQALSSLPSSPPAKESADQGGSASEDEDEAVVSEVEQTPALKKLELSPSENLREELLRDSEDDGDIDDGEKDVDDEDEYVPETKKRRRSTRSAAKRSRLIEMDDESSGADSFEKFYVKYGGTLSRNLNKRSRTARRAQ